MVPGFPALTKAPTWQKVPGESVGAAFLHDDNQKDGNEHCMSPSCVLKGTGRRLAALGVQQGQVKGMKELQHVWGAKEAQPNSFFVPASLPEIQRERPLVTLLLCDQTLAHVYKSNSTEWIFKPHTSKILPPELFKIHLLLVMGRSSAKVKAHPMEMGPPAGGFPRITTAASPACSSFLPYHHILSTTTNNNGVLLGKRDLIAAYTP